MPCRHHDVQVFDGLRCCLACGEAVFESQPEIDSNPQPTGVVPYEYSRLNFGLGQEIRLVVLYPGNAADDIVCDIIHVNLSDNPAYEAISYAWATQEGDASLSQTIYCRGKIIAVTKHCEAALRCFRRQGTNRYLWVDAISINQQDIEERNNQVGFMGSIFSNASQVLIYLGPGTEGTDRVIDYLNGDPKALTQVRRDRLSHIVKDFLDRRWLDRVWCLQEVALARLATITAGSKTADWTSASIQKILTLCDNLRIEPPSVLRWSPASQPEADLLQVLHRCRNCSSTDARDKVFAVLGLAGSAFQRTIPVDYSLTSEEVFTNVAICLIEEQRSLDVLKHSIGQTTSPEPEPSPSWVPKWDIKTGYGVLPAQFNAQQIETLSSVWFTPSLLYGLGNREQPTQDVLDEILLQAPMTEAVRTTAAWYRWVLLWVKKESRSRSKPSIDTGETALLLTQAAARDFHFMIAKKDLSMLCRTLSQWEKLVRTAGPDSKWPCLRVRAHHLDIVEKVVGSKSAEQVHYLQKTAPEAFFGYRHRCRQCTKHCPDTTPCQSSPTVARAMVDEFANELLRLGQGKAVFRTQQSIGVSHAAMQPGDTVWALDGVAVPFILRKEQSHYVLVGECYLYRALRDHPCACCGYDANPWLITTEIIDIW